MELGVDQNRTRMNSKTDIAIASLIPEPKKQSILILWLDVWR